MQDQNAAVLPADESKRLLALHRHKILDTPPEQTFDRITQLAARLFDVPIALISFVDYDRVWFKSKLGIEIREIDRQPGSCASAILSESVYCVGDAPEDPRAIAHALVAGEVGIRFYAAACLRTQDGQNLGGFRGTLVMYNKLIEREGRRARDRFTQQIERRESTEELEDWVRQQVARC